MSEAAPLPHDDDHQDRQPKYAELTPEALTNEGLVAEEMVIGAAIAHPGVEVDIVDQLNADLFSQASLRTAFEAICSLVSDGVDVDLHTLTLRLRQEHLLEDAGGLTNLARIARLAVTSAEAKAYIHLMREAALQRALRNASDAISTLVVGPGSVDQRVKTAQDCILSLEATSTERTSSSYAEMVPNTVARLRDESEGLIHETRITTGFTDLDRHLTGFGPGDLIIVAGRPGMGKTIFAEHLARRFATYGTTAYFSYEMTRDQLVTRSISSAAKVPLSQRQGVPFEDLESLRLDEAAAHLESLPLIIDEDVTLTVQHLVARAIMTAKRCNPSFAGLIVDYLQLMPSSAGKHVSRTDDLGNITSSLKRLGKRLGVPIVLLSQLNREVEHRDNKRPTLSDLRSSGSIEQDADVVILLYRDEYYYPESTNEPGVVEAIIGKQRNGPAGKTAKLAFRGETYTMSDLAQNFSRGQYPEVAATEARRQHPPTGHLTRGGYKQLASSARYKPEDI